MKYLVFGPEVSYAVIAREVITAVEKTKLLIESLLSVEPALEPIFRARFMQMRQLTKTVEMGVNSFVKEGQTYSEDFVRRMLRYGTIKSPRVDLVDEENLLRRLEKL